MFCFAGAFDLGGGLLDLAGAAAFFLSARATILVASSVASRRRKPSSSIARLRSKCAICSRLDSPGRARTE